MDFENKAIVVSGSSSGIGRGVANLLIENNAFVIGMDINDATINHPKYKHYILDVRDEQKVISAVSDIETVMEKRYLQTVDLKYQNNI
ncbi:MAG: hypothetical protein HPY66_1087 [Firmicutes bacterium]|nr:hypothetical protein [Bacillota bacterium]